MLPVTGSLVERYNACLEDIGLEKTSLESFHVDGWGWSPEIAEERANKFYLSHLGVANPYAILISPEQRNKPIYFQYHSFDSHMMKGVWEDAGDQIADLTTTSAIWIDIDQEISAYREPQDLLMIDAITLRFNSAGGIMEAASGQRDLVHQFLNKRMAWADLDLHKQIIESVKQHGDLRFRSVEIPDMPYTHTRCFYTRAFGGLFSFRDLPSGKPVLVMLDNELAPNSDSSGSHLEFHIDDPQLLQVLAEEKLIDLSWQIYQNDLSPLFRLKDALLAHAIAAEDPEVDIVAMKPGDKKKWMLKLSQQGKIDPAYIELERLILKAQRGQEIDLNKLSLNLTRMLTHPHRSLTETAWTAVRQLLLKIAPWDLQRLYNYDKEQFVETYRHWPENLKAWARSILMPS